MGNVAGVQMKIIAGGRGAVNPYAAAAEPHLKEFHAKVDAMRGGSKMALAFNKLNIEERRVIFILGNALASTSPLLMDKLSERHISLDYNQFSQKEKLTVIRGMKQVKRLARKIPYSPPGEEESLKNPRQATPNVLEDYYHEDRSHKYRITSSAAGF